MFKNKFTVFVRKYFSEFALIFISVLLAFALTEWSNNQGKKVSEEKIFLEILNGLKIDSFDIEGNIMAHENGVKACKFWRRIITGEVTTVDTDSLKGYYFALTRSVISVQNVSGYETLKAKGLETIKNDSLRTRIISLYEGSYQIMRKFEEDYQENQFFENYFFEINKKIAPNLIFNESGDITRIELPLNINKEEKNILLSYLWKIQMSRVERAQAGKGLKRSISRLYREIEKEIK